MFTLLSEDGISFQAERDVLERSVLLKNMLEDVQDSSNSIPLPNVASAVLEKVLHFCEHHRGDPLPVPEEDETRMRKIVIEDWDYDFISANCDIVFEIIMAANYLDIKDLLDLGCKYVASLIKGKSTEQIRELFHIVNDLTPEEEEKIKKENQWAEAV
ncbi:hypothetical protein GYMLUDRAFT_78536 [Collybiopsis luxurians FD-317 M1]|uniref:E3 ubiquitin ligase complex SCF subunit n=1 Tax=Collybiopsis luxurians FD-317 M1 TaxID=944289 RepID=A0A0D0B840_9AGAR|nr:hypothetical protein GYMLUDRAFT_78536 [Collybiopsis luxurians FD-317 M1]